MSTKTRRRILTLSAATAVATLVLVPAAASAIQPVVSTSTLHTGHAGAAATFLSDGSVAAISDGGTAVDRFEPSTDTELWTSSVTLNDAIDIAALPNDDLVIATADGLVVLDGDDGASAVTLAVAADAVTVSGDGESIWTVGAGGDVTQVDVDTLTVVETIPTTGLVAADIVEVSGSVYAATTDQIVIIDADTGVQTDTIALANPTSSIAVSQSGQIFATEPTTDAVTMYLTITGTAVMQFGGITDPRSLVMTSDDSHVMVTSESGESIEIIDLESAMTISPIELTVAPAGIALSADRSRAVVASASGTTTVINLVAEAPFMLLTAPDGTVGTEYALDPITAGDPAPELELVSGSLPPGVSITALNELYGTPTVGGEYIFTLSADNGLSDVRTYAIDITEQSTLVSSLPAAQLGEAYSASIVVDAGYPDASWDLSGALPAGLNFDETTGVISGTPTEHGAFPLTASGTNDFVTTEDFLFEVLADAVLQSDLPPAQVGESYSAPTVLDPGYPAVTEYSISGDLPEGLEFDTTTGIISGVPVAAGVEVVTVSTLSGDVDQVFTFVVLAAPPSDLADTGVNAAGIAAGALLLMLLGAAAWFATRRTA